MRIGVISDTHGLLRPEALASLAGVEHILHAGDVGRREILQILETIAPVTAIRGNVDTGSDVADLSETEMLKLDGTLIYMLHSVQDLDLDPMAAGIHLVVSGHSHKPGIHVHKGIVYLNPGSAGPKRFSLPVSLAFADVCDGKVEATLRPLPL